jgi:ribonuclease Y
MVEQDSRNDMARIIRQIEQEARMTVERKAAKIIATAIQRIASVRSAIVTTSMSISQEKNEGADCRQERTKHCAFEQVPELWKSLWTTHRKR